MNNWIVGVGIMRPGPSERKWSRFHAFNSMHSTLSTRRSDPGGGRPASRPVGTFVLSALRFPIRQPTLSQIARDAILVRSLRIAIGVNQARVRPCEEISLGRV